MTVDARVPIRPRDLAGGALLGLLALSVAMVLGYPGVSGIPKLVILLFAGVAAVMVSQTYAGYLIMVASCFMFIVAPIVPERFLNAFDLIIPFMFPTAMFGALRRDARRDEARLEQGEGHAAIRAATHRLIRAVIIFYGLATVSLVQVLVRIGVSDTVSIVFGLARTIEGLILFPLGLWWLNSERRVHQLFGAAFIGGAILPIPMLIDRIVVGTTRPGSTWVLGQYYQWTQDANGVGLIILFLVAMVLARRGAGAGLWWVPMGIAVTITLFASQSRSSMLALAAFVGLNLRRIPVRFVIAGAVLTVAALFIAPNDFFVRMTKTVAMQRGSSELYSWLIRVYGYQSNIRLFLDNWLIGTGFHSGQYLTRNYNELGLPLGAENYFLETAVGMGVIGLGLFIMIFVRMFQLGRVVLSVVPPGTLGYRLAQVHTPLIAAVLVPCLTGNIFVGISAPAQVAMWCALLVRSAHLSLRGEAST